MTFVSFAFSLYLLFHCVVNIVVQNGSIIVNIKIPDAPIAADGHDQKLFPNVE